MAQLASDLATAQFAAKTERLTARSETLDRQISAASTIKNALSTLASSLGDRVRSGDLASLPKVANGAVAQASTPFGTYGKGSYSLEVTQLARRQVLAGPALAAATTPVGAGTLTIRFGTVGGSFAEDLDHAPVAITVPSGATLGDVAGLINGANAGLSAYVANTTAGARLVVKGAEGVENGFIIEAAETEPGLAALAWEPVAGDAARLLESSADALYELDGLPMQSASNETGQIAPGLQLTLTGTNPGVPTSITFGNANEAVGAAMSDLVGALNELAAGLKEATNPVSGDLKSDPGARALRQALGRLAGQVVMPAAAADAPRTLSDLGLAINRDGSFRLDSERLNATLDRDPEGVAAMFTIGLFGVYSTFDKLARDANATGNPGSLAGSIARYQRQATEVSAQTLELAEKQEELRAEMVSRFARADARISASQSTLTFLQQQIDAWNAGNN